MAGIEPASRECCINQIYEHSPIFKKLQGIKLSKTLTTLIFSGSMFFRRSKIRNTYSDFITPESSYRKSEEWMALCVC